MHEILARARLFPRKAVMPGELGSSGARSFRSAAERMDLRAGEPLQYADLDTRTTTRLSKSL